MEDHKEDQGRLKKKKGDDPNEDNSYVEALFFEFLMGFKVDGEIYLFYEKDVGAMKINKPNTMCIDFRHVMKYSDVLSKSILDKYLRIEFHLENACKRFIENKRPIFNRHNFHKWAINVAFYDLPLTNRLRELTCSQLGQLVSVIGVVKHTSEVRPELLEGVFICLGCKEMVYDVKQTFPYTKPPCCLAGSACQNRTKWEFVARRSKFVDSQMVRVQELSSDIPAGCPPRSFDIILRHEIVEQARAGDTVIFTGSVVVIPTKPPLYTVGERTVLYQAASQRRKDSSSIGGPKELGGVKELSYQLAFIANSVTICDDRMHYGIRKRKRSVDEDANPQFTDEQINEIRGMKNGQDFFNKLVDSVAPTVFGHRDIKTAILLMLLGGVHKSTHEGINLRGDIHVCIVGDPSCAKSQFLRYTLGMVSKSVYTSGKSSTAAGLTASVSKQPETGEFCIEAGALMIADNGICCIDEFDKMDLGDQAALYEAMEQQTISITKAGIHITLNARTSILAAANPSSGRYDKTTSLKYNVALPRALLSRFDLVFVMIDEPDDKIDSKIAQCIVRLHQKRENPVDPPFSSTQVKRFIMFAKTLEPKITAEAKKELVDSYVGLRKDSSYQRNFVLSATVRQLEALIRLSEAIARSHLDNKVQRNHVLIAKDLLKTSFISVESSEIDLSEFQEENGEDGVGNSENGNGAGTSSKQGNKLIVTEEYFNRVTRALILRLRQHEETVKQEGTGLAGMRQRDLINWFINQGNSYSSVDEASAEVKKVKAIIESLTRNEGQLLVIGDNRLAAEESGSQSASRNERILAVAPNCAAGD